MSILLNKPRFVIRFFYIYHTMKKVKFIFVCLLIFSFSLFSQEEEKAQFEQLNHSNNWILSFEDTGTERWKSNWFVDGLGTNIHNTRNGMVFSIDKTNGKENGSKAVLWTKKSFEGSVKIEYDYTRTDARSGWVNILYIQATGADKRPYSRDITKWNSLRLISSMRSYFNYMNAYQISYTAVKGDNTHPDNDYVRLRKYPILSDQSFLKETKIPSASYHSGLFKSGVKYHITAIKTKDQIFFQVLGDSSKKIFCWNLENETSMGEGRIGLRHINTRSARYKNFKVYVK